jgi:hypothetical protein
MTAAIQTNCRIGKIRFKSGGEVTVLRKPALNTVQEDLLARVRDDFNDGRTIIGYALVVMVEDSCTLTSFYTPQHFPARLLPEYVAETIRKAMWRD